MKSKFYLASFIACFLVSNGFAQKQNVYFLKDNGQYVDVKDSADYIRIVREPDSGTVLYNVLDYYSNGTPKLVGKSSEIEPVKLEGTVIRYYPDKKKKQIANYEKGKLSGFVYDYYPNGKAYRTLEYKLIDNRPDFETIETIHIVNDSTGVKTVTDGNGHYIVFDNDFKTIKEEGEVKDGKRNGSWKGTLNEGKVTYIEEYADGKFVKGTSTEENGNAIKYMVKEALPTFEGGENSFGLFLSRTVRYPARARDRNAQGKVILGFIVEKDGSLSNIKILKGADPDLDAEALRAIKQSPKWNPATQHGISVRVNYTMPLSFTQPRG